MMNREDFRLKTGLGKRKQENGSGYEDKEGYDSYSVFDDTREQGRKRDDFRRGTAIGFLGCLCLVFVVTLILTGTGILRFSRFSMAAGQYTALENKILSKVNILEQYISAYFLDEVDDKKMADSVYKGVINGLGDDYATYYTEEEFKDIQEKNSGIYYGIGAYIATDQTTGLVQIVKPMKNSPVEKAGGKAGDLIYKVDGKDTTGMEISEVQALVKGKKGSKVILTLIRGNKQVEITVIRDEIKEDTVEHTMLPNKIGYVQVTGFEEVTTEQFSDAVDDLEKQKQKAMIIDLRDNGGGLLDSAVTMLDKILPKGLVVYSEDKKGEKHEYFAEDKDEFTKPLVILVNENSASASEVFSGAIQDEKAGTLIGTQTFGKGIVQGIFDLGDGSALKITTAKYYTPKGRNIHGKGLTPDVEVKLEEKTETLSDGKTKVDNQLKTAWEYLMTK